MKALVTLPEAIRLIADANPLLEAVLVDLGSEWAPDLVPGTVAMGDMGRIFALACDRMARSEIECVCAAVERVISEGTQDAKEAIATGFLEAMLHKGSSISGFDAIVSRLGPASREYCRAWDEFTGVHTPGLWDD